jgi:hypothetical protein
MFFWYLCLTFPWINNKILSQNWHFFALSWKKYFFINLTLLPCFGRKTNIIIITILILLCVLMVSNQNWYTFEVFDLFFAIYHMILWLGSSNLLFFVCYPLAGLIVHCEKVCWIILQHTRKPKVSVLTEYEYALCLEDKRTKSECHTYFCSCWYIK